MGKCSLLLTIVAIYAPVQYDYQNNMSKKIYLLIGVKFNYSWQLVDAANCMLKLIMAFSCNTTTVEEHFWCTQFLICYCKKAVVRQTKRKQNKCLSILPILCHCLAIHLSHSNGVKLLGQGPRTVIERGLLIHATLT